MKDLPSKRLIMLLTVLSVMVIASIMTPLEAISATIWPGTTVPVIVDSGPDSAVELGVKLRSDTAGYITGIRFYKASANTGTHVGNLWSSTGTRLATATFTGESASGWQQVSFLSKVAITANTVYVASYHTNVGHYSDDQNFFATAGVDNAPLHALANGVSGVNGVYAYGSTSKFPNLGWNSSNYWVDVVFNPATPATLSSIAVTPANQTISTGTTQQFIATGTYSDTSTQNLTSQVTWSSSTTSVATITSAGLATGVGAGSSTIKATLSSITGSTTLTVKATPLTITTTSLPGAIQNSAYSTTLTASGGTLPYTWTIASGTLPTGLTLKSTTGAITGTPTSIGAFNFTVKVTDTSNPAQTATKAVSITVAVPPPTLSSIAVTPASQTISTGATEQYTATGTYSDSSTQNLTSQVTWSSSTTSVATINSAGLATGVGAGSSTIKATLGGITGSTTLTVQAATLGVEPAGWYAGDMHVHRSCGGAPQTVSSMYQLMSPNNLAVISLLADMGNGEVQNPVTDLPLVNGSNDPVSTPGQIVHWDSEWHWDPTYTQYPHQAIGGHIVALGLTQASQVWDEYTYPIFNWAHQQGAIAGFAHMQYLDGTNTIPNGLTCCTPIEYPVEVALGSSDFISEDVDNCGSTCGGTASPGVSAPLCPECAIQAYYKLLNCGFRPGFAGGTDYPCNCSNPLGSILTYSQVAGGQMTYSNWIQGIAKGRTVVSRNGHNEFLSLVVNNSATPGDEIKLTSAGSVQVNIQWTANQNYSGTIELVQNGVVVASTQASVSSGVSASLTATVNFEHSGWLAARRMDDSLGHMVHTAAVFVTVNNAPVRASVADAQFFVGWMNNLLTMTSPGGAWNSYFPTSLTQAQARYQAALALYQQIESDAAMLLTITTVSLPGGALNIPYSDTLVASGGTLPYTWSISSGTLPPGLSLNSGTGVISGTPTVIGTFSFTAQVTDSSNPLQTITNAYSITVAQASPTLWPATTVPVVADGGPDSAVELGVTFRSDLNGSITGIRFYKASANTGTHVGNLWTSTGTLLATATFTNETASGWQQVNFSTPVAITANTVYVASYHTNAGHYSDDQNYFAVTGVDSPPLHALADGVSGFNGAYAYGSASSFPNQGWNSSNYWVDVVYQQ